VPINDCIELIKSLPRVRAAGRITGDAAGVGGAAGTSETTTGVSGDAMGWLWDSIELYFSAA
jgi:hypothetical protein